jgi:hypothetical protein
VHISSFLKWFYCCWISPVLHYDKPFNIGAEVTVPGLCDLVLLQGASVLV